MKLLRSFWCAPLVAGALMWASFAPIDAGWLMPLAWAVLFASMRARRGERAGLQVFVASLLLFVPGVSWIRPLVWPLWFVVAFWCAGWEALWGRFMGRYLARGDAPPAAWIVLLPVSHFAVDMARTLVLSGFPWLLTGYSGWRNPVLLGSADLLGVHGASLAILVLGAGLAELACRVAANEPRPLRAILPAGVLWLVLAAWAFGKPSPAERPGPTVLLLQPNIPQFLKEDALASGEERPTMETLWTAHEDLAAKAMADAKAAGRPVDLVVWAETMVPAMAFRPLTAGAPLLTFERTQGDRWIESRRDGLRIAAAARGAESLAGIQSLGEGGERGLRYNTVVLLSADGIVRGHQDKQHLTPGGEYIPLRWLIPFREQFESYLEDMIGFLPDLQPGEAGSVLPLRGGAKAGVLICYESVYPEIPRDLVRSGATMLVNCSNYGWFAGTAEMDQALAMCAFRAAELRRSVVLSSNNGVSAVVGPDGRVRGEATAADVRGSLTAQVPLCDETSPFSLVGEWAAWCASAVALVACLVSRGRAAAGPA